jgi:predicted N-acetyltransferase YhbS
MTTAALYNSSFDHGNVLPPTGGRAATGFDATTLMSQTEVLDRRILTLADARPIAELLAKVFTKRSYDERLTLLMEKWRDYDGPEEFHPRSVIIREGDKVLAHATAAPHTIGTSEGDLTVLGLAHVATDPDVRGRKLGQTVVRAVFDLVDHGPYRHALFQTSHAVQAFYEKLGAGLVTNRIINSLADDPEANPFWDDVVMRYPAVKHWPQDTIDLRGPGW